MANNVYTHVNVQNPSDAVRAKMLEVFSKVRDNQNYKWFSDCWVDGKEGSPSYEEADKYEWTIHNIGSKWCYIEESDDESVHLVSAWSYPQAGVEWLYRQLEAVDPKVILFVSYEDEMPNFYGAEIYYKDGLWDSIEYDDEDLREDMFEEYPELKEHWDEDEEDGNDEFYEIWNDNVYEFMSNKQYEFFKLLTVE